jgi:hypothetical protein
MARGPREETVDIIGTVTMVCVSDPRVARISFDGQEIEAPFKPEDEDIVTTALKEHASVKVRLRGRGRFSPGGKIREITEVDSISLLPGRAAPTGKRKRIWERFQEILKDVPEEELRMLPRDGSVNHDHYIYGLPKKEP